MRSLTCRDFWLIKSSLSSLRVQRISRFLRRSFRHNEVTGHGFRSGPLSACPNCGNPLQKKNTTLEAKIPMPLHRPRTHAASRCWNHTPQQRTSRRTRSHPHLRREDLVRWRSGAGAQRRSGAQSAAAPSLLFFLFPPLCCAELWHVQTHALQEGNSLLYLIVYIVDTTGQAKV